MRMSVVTMGLLLSACVGPMNRPPGTDRSRPGTVQASRPQLAEKVINAKQAPLTLVARDGSRCQVDSRVYQETRLGDKVNCVWEQ